MLKFREPIPHWCGSREGVIIECPLNEQYHDRRDVILTSGMAVSNNFFIVKSCYYDDQRSINVIITENDDLEMMVSENHD